ncbi:MAG: CDP-diacylglycerol--glycerol-3-phosphate 3-phosphatidyltransferase [Clostridia bacterium]|nr:CDP-diacylglycerol--glycerol-3-phosphate 3-phosphatidyltransferase [Clostridia bacterium]
MNTPNKITLSRLLLIPLVVFFYLADFIPYSKLVATIIFIGACLTDFLDGHIARKYNQVTTLGKFFDTIADKVLIMTGLLLICAGQVIGGAPVVYPSWLGIVCVVIILAREFIVSALRQIAASKGTVLAADMGGKIKATAQYVVVSLYMFLAFFEQSIAPALDAGAMNKALPIIRFILMILLAFTTFLTIYSGASYLIRNRHVFKEDKEEEAIAKEIVEEEQENKDK